MRLGIVYTPPAIGNKLFNDMHLIKAFRLLTNKKFQPGERDRDGFHKEKSNYLKDYDAS